MKKVLTVAMSMLAAVVSMAQTADAFRAQCERQMRVAGVAGPGVETVLDKWAAAYPDDTDMLEARFNYYLAKSRSERVLPLIGKKRFLGEEPVLTLRDSTGAPVPYFQVPEYDDSLFRLSQQAIDRAIALKPEVLLYRFDRISALAAYEKESPDMAATAVLDLIDLNSGEHPAWEYGGKPVNAVEFSAYIQQYCYVFYRTGSANSYEAFRIVSERMLRDDPRNTTFLGNLGSYWQVARRDDRRAAKYYRRVLKIDPDDSAAKKNLSIIEKNKQSKHKK